MEQLGAKAVGLGMVQPCPNDVGDALACS